MFSTYHGLWRPYFLCFWICTSLFLCRNLGWEQKSNEDHQTAMLRGEVLTALAILNHEITSKEAIRRFNIFLEDKNTTILPPATRKVWSIACFRLNWIDFAVLVQLTWFSSYHLQGHIYCCYEKWQHWRQAWLESLLKLYRETDVAQEKARILSELFQTNTKGWPIIWVNVALSFLLAGALASSPDPDIVVEALNFLLSSEVSIYSVEHHSCQIFCSL